MKPFNITALVRENILKLKPYSSARDEFSGSASVFLDANENPYNAPPLNRYPDPDQLELKEADRKHESSSWKRSFWEMEVMKGIDLLFRVFV